MNLSHWDRVRYYPIMWMYICSTIFYLEGLLLIKPPIYWFTKKQATVEFVAARTCVEQNIDLSLL